MYSLRTTLVLAAALGAATACEPGEIDDGNVDAADDTGKADSFFGGGSACPTAPERPLTWWRWRTFREAHLVVWANDDGSLLVAERLSEERQNLLTDYVDARKLCHRLAIYNPDGTKLMDVGGEYPGHAFELSFMATEGYAVVASATQDEQPAIHRVTLGGARKKLVTFVPCDGDQVIPSPDGSRLAHVHTVTSCDGPASGSALTVSFLDAAGVPTGSTSTVTFGGVAQATFTATGDLVLSDGVGAVRVAADGQQTAAAVPGCMYPATTSSDVASDGRVVAIEAGHPVIVGTEPDRAFGCQ